VNFAYTERKLRVIRWPISGVTFEPY